MAHLLNLCHPILLRHRLLDWTGYLVEGLYLLSEQADLLCLMTPSNNISGINLTLTEQIKTTRHYAAEVTELEGDNKEILSRQVAHKNLSSVQTF